MPSGLLGSVRRPVTGSILTEAMPAGRGGRAAAVRASGGRTARMKSTQVRRGTVEPHSLSPTGELSLKPAQTVATIPGA